MVEKKLILVFYANEIYSASTYKKSGNICDGDTTLLQNNDSQKVPNITTVDDVSNKENLDDEYAVLNNKFFDSLTFSYLPLLLMFEKLEKDSIPFKIAFVMSSILCKKFSDKNLLNNYKQYLSQRIELGEREVVRQRSGALYQNVLLALEVHKRALDRIEKMTGTILDEFASWATKGNLEILATTATNIFLPLYSDITSTLRAQIDTGVRCFKNYFKEMPNGFWLPYQSYVPGIENILREYNINYTILNERSFLLSKNEPKRGIFYPASFDNSVACFSNDTDVNDLLFGKNGYCQCEDYLDPMGDIGYLYDTNDLFPYLKNGDRRVSLGYKYYNKSKKSPQFLHSDECIYDINKAFEQCKMDAKDFIAKEYTKLAEAQTLVTDTDFLSLVIPIDLHLFESKWREGIYFLESCIREASLMAQSDDKDKAITFDFAKSVLEHHYNLQIIHPYRASDSKSGFGDEYVTDKNSYMLTYTRKAARRMADMTRRFPDQTGLRQRLLRIAATELLLAEDSIYAQMIDSGWLERYAKQQFKQCINDFTQVFESLGSNEVSTLWLTNLEKEHDLFPFINYKIWAK